MNGVFVCLYSLEILQQLIVLGKKLQYVCKIVGDFLSRDATSLTRFFPGEPK